MRIALFIALGVAAGAIFYHIPRAVEEYSQRGLPDPPYAGPRFRYWKDGVEILGG